MSTFPPAVRPAVSANSPGIVPAGLRSARHMRHGILRNRGWATLPLALALLVAGAPAAAAGEKYTPQVEWGEDYRTLSINFLGKEVSYPGEMLKGEFPPAGAEPEFRFEKDWPVVTMRARWTMPGTGWPSEYRPNAIDLILMFACNAQLYEHIAPEAVSSSSFTHPPVYLKEVRDPGQHNLAEKMRGKTLGYEVTAKAGFGASDYKIRTKIRVGLSGDGKTVFYYDRPEYISDYLERKDYFFAAHDGGKEIRFEARMVAVCAPRRALKGKMMSRVEESAGYFVKQIYKSLGHAPAGEKIEKFLERVKQQQKSITTTPGTGGP